MPQAIDLSIANAANVAKTFSLLAPAAGHGGMAEWALKEGLNSTVFPRLTAVANATTNRSRNLKLKFRLPSSYTDPASGLVKTGSAFEFNGTASVPDDFPESLKADAVAYTKNIVAHALIQSMMRDGLPAT